VGRSVIGSHGGASAALREFLAGQKVQVGTDLKPIEVDTQWLDVGHVDETVCFVPAGSSYKILVPDPETAVSVLHMLMVGGEDDAPIRVGTNYDNSHYDTVEGLLVYKRNSVVQKTTLAATAMANATNLSLSTPMFANGDVLRLQDEYVLVTAGGGTSSITVTPAQIGTSPAEHTAGTLVYALSTRIIENITPVEGVGMCPQKRIGKLTADLGKELGIGADRFVKLPVIFDRSGHLWGAYTSNVVNCLVVEDNVKRKAFMPDTFGPKANGSDWFQLRIIGNMAGTVSPIFIDAWSLHCAVGEVHCASNASRLPFAGENWWQAWPTK
jgi:hypothetical protein